MKVLPHNHVSKNRAIILAANLFQDFQKQITATCRTEKLQAMVATARDEVPVSATLNSAQSFRHGGSL